MTDKEVMKNLDEDVCQCGANKERGKSFCRKCHHLLPNDLKKLSRYRLGYLGHFRNAAKFLYYKRKAVETK
jgi:hypothetical protein